MEAIAEFECIAIEKDGRRFNLRISIGRPYKTVSDPETWACPLSLDPLYRQLSDIAGADSFQALCLASRMAVELLSGFKQNGGKLVDQDGNDVQLSGYLAAPKGN